MNGGHPYTTHGEMIPILPIRNSVIFPGISIPIKVSREVGIKAIEEAQKTHSTIITLTQKNLNPQQLKEEDLYHIGTLSSVDVVRKVSNGLALKVTGLKRVRVYGMKQLPEELYYQAYYEDLNEQTDLDQETQDVLLRNIKKISLEILQLIGEGQNFISYVEKGQDLSTLINFCAQNINASISVKQELLELTSLKNKGLKILELLAKQKATLQIQMEMNEKITDKVGKAHRESILREQLRTIKEELGEDGGSSATDNYEEKIEKANMPEDVKKVAREELRKLESLGPTSPETHVIRNYLDLLCALPWQPGGTPDIDLIKARAILNEDHYGLDKIKERVIQHLAVLKLKKEKDKKGSILLFVGPPGVGKTSLGRSIARALGRKFIRVGLGGVRDDSEIRGHRRTYIGAMPGRIIQGLKKAQENNPVFMLDEIDKLSRGFSGDPASALLEVLDPEQNFAFLDHYLDVNYDLSGVFFIATANSLETIPGPLLDRLEVIELTGHTDREKLHIAQEHLVPKQLEEHGLTSAQLQITEEALKEIISSYTREAGVRDLQRKISTLCRSLSEKVLQRQSQTQNQNQPIIVTEEDLDHLLGSTRFVHEIAEVESPPGVVTGLAWTPLGGEILFIESSSMPGTGKLMITGQLGEVMKESAQIALSLVRSKIGILNPNYQFAENDIHLHVPSGAIPKDGPSAGVAMVVAMASLILGKKVDSHLAMTGEITLRGTVMPVGGIKEKVIAAHRAGISKIILSQKNKKDLQEVPEEAQKSIEFFFVENVSQVLKAALNINFLLSHSPPFHGLSGLNGLNGLMENDGSSSGSRLGLIDF